MAPACSSFTCANYVLTRCTNKALKATALTQQCGMGTTWRWLLRFFSSRLNATSMHSGRTR
eukprot:6383669-Pyramimonas_sp.AAC.1